MLRSVLTAFHTARFCLLITTFMTGIALFILMGEEVEAQKIK